MILFCLSNSRAFLLANGSQLDLKIRRRFFVPVCDGKGECSCQIVATFCKKVVCFSQCWVLHTDREDDHDQRKEIHGTGKNRDRLQSRKQVCVATKKKKKILSKTDLPWLRLRAKGAVNKQLKQSVFLASFTQAQPSVLVASEQMWS